MIAPFNFVNITVYFFLCFPVVNYVLGDFIIRVARRKHFLNVANPGCLDRIVRLGTPGYANKCGNDYCD